MCPKGSFAGNAETGRRKTVEGLPGNSAGRRMGNRSQTGTRSTTTREIHHEEMYM